MLQQLPWQELVTDVKKLLLSEIQEKEKKVAEAAAAVAEATAAAEAAKAAEETAKKVTDAANERLRIVKAELQAMESDLKPDGLKPIAIASALPKLSDINAQLHTLPNEVFTGIVNSLSIRCEM